MAGLDEQLAGLGGGGLGVALLVAVLLGLRHATDPDHLAAVSTLVLSGDDRGAHRARALGFAWGAGHALTLVALGIPVVLWGSRLPDSAQRAAELAVAAIIALLAARLLLRSHLGRPLRSRRAAFGIGLVHGVGGSAGVGILVIGGASGGGAGVAALVLFATATALSMAAASTAWGLALTRGVAARHLGAAAPAFAVAGLLFASWYALGALERVPYPL